jgi:DNA-binding CsgD family transcriptional regulator
VLIGPRKEVIACNDEAIKILSYPDPPAKLRTTSLLARRLPAGLLGKSGGVAGERLGRLVSGRRRYLCTAHPLVVRGKNEENIAILLERTTSPDVMLYEVSKRYNLTQREREAMRYLVHGLTSKEIAQQMKISPNTVKAFLRLVMTKMGVCTRAGVIGKIAGIGEASRGADR